MSQVEFELHDPFDKDLREKTENYLLKENFDKEI